MSISGLHGPLYLAAAVIDRHLIRTSPGVYALGETQGPNFVIRYVGRSDLDLAERLKDWIGRYRQFKFAYYASAKAAYEKECTLWHDFGGPAGRLDNARHPARPMGGRWQCARCDVFALLASW